jgi:hypothetical protein
MKDLFAITASGKLDSSPANRRSIFAQPGAPLFADRSFDAHALGGGLTHGSTATGLSVEFTYLGKGTRTAQVFNIVDPNTDATLVGSQTTAKATSAPDIDLGSSDGCIAFLNGTLTVLRGRKSCFPT